MKKRGVINNFILQCMCVLVAASALEDAVAAPLVLTCQVTDIPAPAGRFEIAIDRDIGVIHVQQENGRIFRIVESGEQWIRGLDGKFRIAIDRRNGTLIMGQPGGDMIEASCARIGERLF